MLVRELRESAVLMRLQADDFEKLAERQEHERLSDGEVVNEVAGIVGQTNAALQSIFTGTGR